MQICLKFFNKLKKVCAYCKRRPKMGLAVLLFDCVKAIVSHINLVRGLCSVGNLLEIRKRIINLSAVASSLKRKLLKLLTGVKIVLISVIEIKHKFVILNRPEQTDNIVHLPYNPHPIGISAILFCHISSLLKFMYILYQNLLYYVKLENNSSIFILFTSSICPSKNLSKSILAPL